MAGMAARRERENTPRGTAAIPSPFDVEEDSTAHALEERDQIREAREEIDRIRKLERNRDHDRDHFNAFKLEVVERLVGVEGGLESVSKEVAGIGSTLTDLRSDLREDRKLRQKEQLIEKEVRLKGELANKEAEQKIRHLHMEADIDVGREEKKAEVTIRTDGILWTRKLILTVATGVFSAGGIGAVIAILARRC